MKKRSLAALSIAISLAISPITYARSGFSSNSSSSARSGFMSKSGSGNSRPSGFTRSGPAKTAATVTGLGAALYSARASKAAADTYTANNAPPAQRRSNDTPPSGTTPSVATDAGTGSSTQYASTTPTAPTEVHHYHSYSPPNSDTTSLLLGYMAGRASRHDTVVVQQPAPQYTQPSQDAPRFAAAPDQPASTLADVQARHESSAATGETNRNSAVSPDDTSKRAATESNGIMGALMAALAIALLIYGGFLLWRAWAALKAKHTATNNYTL